MKFLLKIFITIVFIFIPVKSEEIILDELVKPAMMTVKNGKLYILENTTIKIYDLKNYKLINTFGKSGEGPAEFIARPFGPPMSMSFVDEKLVINSNNKLSYFSPSGKFLSERKAFANLVLYQVKDNFVTIGPSIDSEKKFRISFRLFSNNFKEIAKLFHTNISVNPQQDIILPLSAFTYNPSYKDKIFVVSSNEDFIIDIFDHKGNKVRKIKKDYVKQKIPNKFKNETYYWFKNYSMFKSFYQNIKKFIKFKENFPAIRDISLADNKIHVITYKRKNDLWECIILDLKGKEIKRIFVPLDRYIPFTYYAILYSIDKGKLYSLIENEDEETWELKITDLR